MDRKLKQVLRGSPYYWNPQRIILVSRVVFPMSTLDKEITLFPMLVERREVKNNRPGSGPLRHVQEAFRGLLHMEEIQQQSYTRDPRPLSLKKTKKPTKTPQKLRERWDRHMLKCCKTLFMKGCKGNRRPFSKAASKKQTILGTNTT